MNLHAKIATRVINRHLHDDELLMGREAGHTAIVAYERLFLASVPQWRAIDIAAQASGAVLADNCVKLPLAAWRAERPATSTIVYGITDDGAFVAGEIETRITAYAYPSSDNAAKGKKRPLGTAIEMILAEKAIGYRGTPELVATHDRRNWRILNGEKI